MTIVQSLLTLHKLLYFGSMNVTIPQSLKKQITANRAKVATSEAEYVRNALIHYDHLLRLDSDLKAEMELWDKASNVDTNSWFHKNNT
jgi:hypothetical protein